MILDILTAGEIVELAGTAIVAAVFIGIFFYQSRLVAKQSDANAVRLALLEQKQIENQATIDRAARKFDEMAKLTTELAVLKGEFKASVESSERHVNQMFDALNGRLDRIETTLGRLLDQRK